MPAEVLSVSVAILGGFALVFFIRTKPTDEQRRIRDRENAECERLGLTRKQLLGRFR